MVLVFILCVIGAWFFYEVKIENKTADKALISMMAALYRFGQFVKHWIVTVWMRSQSYAIYQNLSSYLESIEQLKIAKYIRFVKNYPVNPDIEVFQFELYGINEEYRNDLDSLSQLLTLKLRDFFLERLGNFSPAIYLYALENGGFSFWIAKNPLGDKAICDRIAMEQERKRPVIQDGLPDAANDCSLALGWNLELYETYGIKQPVILDIWKKPSGLVTGASGSGKSYFVTAFLHHILRIYGEKVVVYYCDFKSDDATNYLTPYQRFYRGEQCADGLTAYYEEFQAVRDGQRDGKLRLLFFDEWAGFLLWETQKSKKQADIYKGMLQEILLMGRSLLCGAWIILQRPDSAWLGGRENFHSVCCFLSGGVSSELGKMISLEEETVEKIRQRDFFQVGEAVFKSDGRKTVFMKTGKITDVEVCQNEIMDVLLREDGEAVRAEAETPPS